MYYRYYTIPLLLLLSILITKCNGLDSKAKSRETAATNEASETLDDQSLLDLFGASAKEFLTTQLIPETSPECKWNWQHGRCEPFCECSFQFVVGDFHLGRSCRLRSNGDDAPTKCDAPPDNNLYAMLVRQAVDRSNAVKTRALTSLASYRARTCEDLPTECDASGEDHRRSLKERIVCRHIPKPVCDSEHENETISRFVSPLQHNVSSNKKISSDNSNDSSQHAKPVVEDPVGDDNGEERMEES